MATQIDPVPHNELDDRALQRHAGDDGAGMAFVLGVARHLGLLVIARDLDDGVAAVLKRAIAQCEQRGEEYPVAGHPIGLVGGIGLSVGGMLAQGARRRRVYLVAEVERHRRTECLLGLGCGEDFGHGVQVPAVACDGSAGEYTEQDRGDDRQQGSHGLSFSVRGVTAQSVMPSSARR
jgi:hypothetical protein